MKCWLLPNWVCRTEEKYKSGFVSYFFTLLPPRSLRLTARSSYNIGSLIFPPLPPHPPLRALVIGFTKVGHMYPTKFNFGYWVN